MIIKELHGFDLFRSILSLACVQVLSYSRTTSLDFFSFSHIHIVVMYLLLFIMVAIKSSARFHHYLQKDSILFLTAKVLVQHALFLKSF